MGRTKTRRKRKKDQRLPVHNLLSEGQRLLAVFFHNLQVLLHFSIRQVILLQRAHRNPSSSQRVPHERGRSPQPRQAKHLCRCGLCCVGETVFFFPSFFFSWQNRPRVLGEKLTSLLENVPFVSKKSADLT